MADSSISSSRFSETDFRVGRVFNRTSAILSRNFLTYFLIAGAAAIPGALLQFSMGGSRVVDPTGSGGMLIVAMVLGMVFGILSQAAIVYAAFQDMRGRPASLGDCLRVGLGRFFPIFGLAILMSLGIAVGFMALIVPGVILAVMWFVAAPACIVEQLGPIRSLGRSSQLTKGNRWKIVGALLLIYLVAMVVGGVLGILLPSIIGSVGGLIGSLLWAAIWGAFYAIFVSVMYHDLRAAKEGVDIEQIASVFD
jgi:hypothetical protein